MKQITSFWNWFQDNEVAIKNAIASGINAREVFNHLNRNYHYISKGISYIIITTSNHHDKYTIIFTAAGCKKLFPIIIALEDQAPNLSYFTPQAFIKPIINKTTYPQGKDKTFDFNPYKIKISQLYMALVDYNITTKQIKINLFIQNYHKIKYYDGFEANMKYLVMVIIGEIAYEEHIKHIELFELPTSTKGLISLIELPSCINYLFK